MKQLPVCVRHRDGWCATRRKRLPTDNEVTDAQPTLCKHYVVAPWGYEFRRPTCPECLAILKAKESPSHDA